MCRIIKLLSIFTTIMRILTIFFILLVRVTLRKQISSFKIKGAIIIHSFNNSSLRKQISCFKIKGAIIIHVKFSGARKLKISRCFRILHVQILSGFKNWDIQNLTLRRCAILKSYRWNFFTFSCVIHYRKICKNQV